MFGGRSESGAAAAGPTPSGVKRKRTPRATSGQVDAFLSILEARPYLHTRKFTGLQGRENFDEGWKEVASELNQLPNSSKKIPEQWMTVWRDFKSRACSKAARLQKERVQTGNQAVTTAPLTEVERRYKMLAEAAKTQAMTSIMFANAADKISDAMKRQAEASLVFANTADKIAGALIKIGEKM